MKGVIEVRVSLRPKNQMTLPDPVVKRLGLKPGDSLIVRLDESEPESVCIRKLPLSYSGIAAGAYGTAEEVATYVQGERDAWS